MPPCLFLGERKEQRLLFQEGILVFLVSHGVQLLLDVIVVGLSQVPLVEFGQIKCPAKRKDYEEGDCFK